MKNSPTPIKSWPAARLRDPSRRPSYPSPQGLGKNLVVTPTKSLRRRLAVTHELVTLDRRRYSHVAGILRTGSQDAPYTPHAYRSRLGQFVRQSHHDFHRRA